MAREIVIFEDPETLSIGVADALVKLAGSFLKKQGSFSVALSGGQTPRRVYEEVAAPNRARRVDWDRVLIFWGDERCVPMDDPDSNYRMAYEALLCRVPIPRSNIHPMYRGGPSGAAAVDYEGALRKALEAHRRTPRLDLILLGLGADGHTASIFPESEAAAETTRLVTTASHHLERITFTPPLINAARHIWFLATGKEKAKTLARVLEGNDAPQKLPARQLPARLIHPDDGALQWFVDRPAASMLPR